MLPPYTPAGLLAGNATSPAPPPSPPIRGGEVGVLPLAVATAVTLAGILVVTVYNMAPQRRTPPQLASLGVQLIDRGVKAFILTYFLFQSSVWAGIFNTVYAQLAPVMGVGAVTVSSFYDLVLLAADRILKSWNMVSQLLAVSIAAYVGASVAESLEICALGLCSRPLAFAGIFKSVSEVVVWASLVDLVMVKPVAMIVLVALGYLYYPLLAIAIILWSLVVTERIGRRLLAFLLLVPVTLFIPLVLAGVIDASLKAYLAALKLAEPELPTGNAVLDALRPVIQPIINFFYSSVDPFLAKVGAGIAQIALDMFFEVAAIFSIYAAWQASAGV